MKYWVDGYELKMTPEEASLLHHKLRDFEWFIHNLSRGNIPLNLSEQAKGLLDKYDGKMENKGRQKHSSPDAI